ncbi:hypothetical protein B932_3104 [Gluconobacter oxydans H24]|nr:hypothetical protein B932_3104 [Gluconobacter oxydans H24]
MITSSAFFSSGEAFFRSDFLMNDFYRYRDCFEYFSFTVKS